MTPPRMGVVSWLRNQLQETNTDLLRERVATWAGSLMSAEADALSGAVYGERSPDHVNPGNGCRAGERDTRAGTIELEIPGPRCRVRFVFAQPDREAASSRSASSPGSGSASGRPPGCSLGPGLTCSLTPASRRGTGASSGPTTPGAPEPGGTPSETRPDGDPEIRRRTDVVGSFPAGRRRPPGQRRARERHEERVRCSPGPSTSARPAGSDTRTPAAATSATGTAGTSGRAVSAPLRGDVTLAELLGSNVGSRSAPRSSWMTAVRAHPRRTGRGPGGIQPGA